MSEDNQQKADQSDEIEKPVRARRKAVPRKAVEKSHKAFYPDDQPQIPKVRRASLKQTQIEVLPMAERGLDDDNTRVSRNRDDLANRTTKKHKRAEIHPFTGLEERNNQASQQSSKGQASQPAQKEKRAEMHPFTGLEDHAFDRQHKRTNARATQRPYKSGNRLAAHRKGNYPSQSNYAFFWRRWKNWILIGSLALLLLALTPFALGIVHNLTGHNAKTSISTTSSVPISKLQSIPSNSHELVIVPPKTSHPAPPVFAAAAYLLNTDNEATLYAQNAFTHLPMLSTTKLMTATIAMETGNLDQQITITSAMEGDIGHLSSDSAIFGVKVGETYTLRDLIYGLLFVSGNDAALVIADALAGSVPDFVAEMNQKAQILGMNDTHFVNPHGLLDPGQYSCARDLAVLGQYSLSIPALQLISAAKTYRIAAAGKHGERQLINENQFLWWFPGVSGGKTGFDGISDFVQVMSVTRDNHHLVGVVIHTNNWWTDMRDMMNYGFNNYTWISPRDVDASGHPVPYDNLWNYFATDTQSVNVSLAPDQRYYVYTGYTVSGAILTYFDKNGGLKKFGFPLKMPVPSSSTSMTQQFQHGSILCNLTNNQCSTV
ncbi:MAG TPA: serine hydrolase [Ktedonobacteraceae bacterium]